MNKPSNNLLRYSLGFLFIFSLNIASQEIEEVVVTATKKSESIQDLALSIEAFTSEDMTENMIDDMSDLAEVVPGLIMDKGIGSGSSYSIRGTGSYGVGAAVIGAVVTASNGHSYNSSTIADIGFFDVERVEVLKGPQGTLFGRNAVAGVVNFITARPSQEFEGSYDMDMGNYGANKTNLVLNLPFSDSVRARLAYVSNTRDGVTENINLGTTFNDRDSEGLRFSVDFDINDFTTLQLTHETYKSDDNRTNIGTIVCATDPLYGCSPFEAGTPNQTADSRGSVGSLFNLIGMLDYTADRNSYAGATVPSSYRVANLNRDPVHKQTAEFSTLQLNTELSDSWSLIAKYSYATRDYYHMNDSDYSVSPNSFAGLLAPPPPAGYGLGPISWTGCFGGGGFGFCEEIDSDRTYEFSVVETESQQAEITLISDLDGPINYVLGAYTFDSRNNNRYLIQTASWNMLRAFSQHPYNATVFGGALTGYGSSDFYIPLVLGAPGTFAPAVLGGLMAATGKYETPVDIQGFINEDHVRAKSFSLFGEMYVDLSEVTKLTLGLRYNDNSVKDSVASCITFFSCPNYPKSQKLIGEYGFYPTQVTETDDALAYKLAIQHDLSDNQMVYASYTTASKAGGNNPNSTGTPDPYDPEETGVLELGTKSILMDGALLFNATMFMNKTDGMLISSIVNAGSKNNNVDAEINGFEGNMIFFFNETTSINFNWLKVKTEIKDFSLISPTNINGATTRIGPVANGDPQGIVRYGMTDKGLIFKSAGYVCTQAFNPLGGVPCPESGLGTPVNVSGNQLPQSPELSYSLSLNKDFLQSSGVTSARVTYRFQAEREGDVFNTDRTRMNAHKFLDLKVTYQPNDSDWYVAFFAKNLVDNVYVGTWASASALQGGALFATYTDPKTYGIQFGTSF